jgi:hypothetical protein
MLSAIGMCVESEGEVRENATDQAQDKIKQKSDFAKKNTFHCLRLCLERVRHENQGIVVLAKSFLARLAGQIS